MYYSSLRKYDISNGPGVRTTLFVSGCLHNCPGCFNEKEQDFYNGEEFTKDTEDLILEYLKDDKVCGINLLGGDPLFQTQDSSLYNLISRIKKETNKSIWMWTGFLYEDILKRNDLLKMIENVDVLIDGRFDLNKRDLTLKYKGSSNQRVIDLNKSRENKKLTCII